MRVVFPAVLDGFECADQDCACRQAMRAATAVKPGPAGQFPFREIEKAALRGAARIANDQGTPAKAAPANSDFPIAAVASPGGAELYFATLCPMVRAYLAASEEAVDLARSEGGWRAPLQVFQPDGGGKLVRLSGAETLPWRQFQILREQLLDVIADPKLSLLARLARVGHLVDQVVGERAVPSTSPLLTPRGFLAFRSHLEGRMAAADAKALGAFLAKTAPLFPDLDLELSQFTDVAAALHGDWREPLRRWVAPAEVEAARPLEAYFALRLFATPLERDQSLQRGHAELQEGTALGLRLAAAVGQVLQQPLRPVQLLACLALAEAHVVDAAKGLPIFERPVDSHDRGPRMADLDMTLESLA